VEVFVGMIPRALFKKSELVGSPPPLLLSLNNPEHPTQAFRDDNDDDDE